SCSMGAFAVARPKLCGEHVMSCYVVTGAAGFLGRNLVRRLVANGHQVRALVRGNADAVRVGAPGAQIVTADLLDPGSIRSAVQGADIVCHCAAKLPANASPEELWKVNVGGTANLVDMCVAERMARLVFISTDSVYADSVTPPTEDSPLDPSHVYEGNYPHSKIEGERLVLEAWKSQGLPVSIIRPCLIYGPDPSAGTDHLGQWATKRLHPLIGGGRCRISTVFVTDAAAAVELVAESPIAAGRIYNVTDGQPLSKREILDHIAEVTGRPKTYVTLPGKPLYAFSRLVHSVTAGTAPTLAQSFDPQRVMFSLSDHVLNIDRITKELGYVPRVDFREGLKLTLGRGVAAA
ncbi:MAG TPA: NAD-dependent epimerase/dehydratase family protein, partial [Bryobacteraceae bacterium]|nr:NAD-dependent epimerase/dehydratase family protein [Bryobacteraceae bacterium]